MVQTHPCRNTVYAVADARMSNTALSSAKDGTGVLRTRSTLISFTAVLKRETGGASGNQDPRSARNPAQCSWTAKNQKPSTQHSSSSDSESASSKHQSYRRNSRHGRIRRRRRRGKPAKTSYNQNKKTDDLTSDTKLQLCQNVYRKGGP